MSSFSTLNTALTALNYNRVGMDVAAGNIANVSTEGYTRRRAESASAGANVAPALWSRSEGVGEGVQISGITRLSDELLNVRARREHANQSYLDVQQSAMERIEDGIGEPGENGLGAALTSFRASWADLVNSPTSSAARAGVLAKANAVVDAVASQVRNVQAEAGDQRMLALADVSEVNTLARDLARANTAIASGSQAGSDVSSLLDSRDQLTLRISELTGATTSINSDGTATVTVGGATLVSGSQAGTFAITSGITASGEADGSAVTFSVTDPGGASTAIVPGGELGGVAQLLNTTLPGYLSSLGSVVQGIADTVNTQHQAGYDADGNAGTAFFDYDSSDVLGTFKVNLSDVDLIAASSTTGGGTDAGNAGALASLSGLSGSYQRLVTEYGTAVIEVRRQAANQQVMTTQVDGAREQLSGVNIDEEMVNMVSLQRAYEAASRLMTTVDSMLDTLINRMGVG